MKSIILIVFILTIGLVTAEKYSVKSNSKNVSEKRQLTFISFVSKLLAAIPMALLWKKLIGLTKLPIATFVYAKALALGTTLLLNTKPIALALGTIYSAAFLLGMLFPSTQSYLVTTSFRQMANYVGSFFEFDGMDGVIRVLDFTDTTFDYVGVKEEWCREKAACELGVYLAKGYPSAATIFRIMGDEAPTKYGGAFVRGTNLENCEKLYQKCLYSPGERFFN